MTIKRLDPKESIILNIFTIEKRDYNMRDKIYNVKLL